MSDLNEDSYELLDKTIQHYQNVSESWRDELFCQLVERLKELKQLRAEKDFSDPPDLESYKKGYIDGFNEGYKARERDAN